LAFVNGNVNEVIGGGVGGGGGGANEADTTTTANMPNLNIFCYGMESCVNKSQKSLQAWGESPGASVKS